MHRPADGFETELGFRCQREVADQLARVGRNDGGTDNFIRTFANVAAHEAFRLAVEEKQARQTLRDNVSDEGLQMLRSHVAQLLSMLNNSWKMVTVTSWGLQAS